MKAKPKEVEEPEVQVEEEVDEYGGKIYKINSGGGPVNIYVTTADNCVVTILSGEVPPPPPPKPKP